MALQNGHANLSAPSSRPMTPTRSSVEAELQKLEASLRLDPRNVAAHNRVAEYCMTQRLYGKAYQFFQSSHREDNSQLLPILKMALIKFEMALESSFASDPLLRDDMVTSHLQQASRHLKEFKMRVETNTNEVTRRKQSYLLAIHATLNADALLAQTDRLLFNSLSQITEEPSFYENIEDSPCQVYEKALEDAVKSFPAFFTLHHRLLSYWMHFGLYSRVISHLNDYNISSTGLTTNLEWSRWGSLFLDSYFASHISDSEDSVVQDDYDSDAKKAPVDLLQLILLRLQFKKQLNTIILSNPTFNDIATLNKHKSDYDRCLSESSMLMNPIDNDEEEDAENEGPLRTLSSDWSLWRSELESVAHSLQFRHSLRIAALDDSNRSSQWTLVQQAWNHFWKSCGDDSFQSILRWTLSDSDWRSKAPLAQNLKNVLSSSSPQTPPTIDFDIPSSQERLLRLSSDIKLAYLLISSTSSNSIAASSLLSKAFFVARLNMDSFELPPWASSHKLLLLALKIDMILLSHSNMIQIFDAVRSLLAFYFEINCAEALFTLSDYLVTSKDSQRKEGGVSHSTISIIDVFTFIYLTGVDNSPRRFVSWSSPLVPLTDLINQPHINACSLSSTNITGIWVEIAKELNGTASNVSSQLKAFVGQESSSASAPLTTPRKGGPLGTLPQSDGKGILTPKILRGGFGVSSPFRPQSPFSMASSKVSFVTSAANEALLSSADTNSVFSTTAVGLRKVWLGIFNDPFASLPPSTLTQLPKPLTTMLLIFSWAAHRYRGDATTSSHDLSTSASTSLSTARDFDKIHHIFQSNIFFPVNAQFALTSEKAGLFFATHLVSIFNQAQSLPIAVLELCSVLSTMKNVPEALLIAGESIISAKDKGIQSSPSLDKAAVQTLFNTIIQSLEKFSTQRNIKAFPNDSHPRFPSDFDHRFDRLRLAIPSSSESLATSAPKESSTTDVNSSSTPSFMLKPKVERTEESISASSSPMKFGVPSLGDSSSTAQQTSISTLQQGYSARLQKLKQKMHDKKAEKHGTSGAELDYLKPFTSNFTVPSEASVAAPAPLISPEARDTSVQPTASIPSSTIPTFVSKPSTPTPAFGFGAKPSTTPSTFGISPTTSSNALTAPQPTATGQVSTSTSPAPSSAESAQLVAQLKAVKDESNRLAAQRMQRETEDKARESEWQRMRATMDAEKAAMAAMKADMEKQRLELANMMKEQQLALEQQLAAEKSRIALEMSKLASERATVDHQKAELQKDRLKLEEEKKHEQEVKKKQHDELARIKAEHEAALLLDAQNAEAARMERQAEEDRLEEERLEAERLAMIEEARLAQEIQLANEAQIAEEKKKAQEEADRIAAQKAEEDRLEADRKAKEESDRLAEEARIAEEARLAEEEKKIKEENDRIAAQKAEEDRLEAERKAKEESDRLAEEARLAAEETRIAEEKKIKEENDRIAAQKAEEARLEAERLAEEEKRAEAARIAEEARLAEEKNLQEEADRIAAQKAEEDRLEAERKAKEESDRLAEEARLAAEEAHLAEEKKAQEEADRIAAQKVEEARLGAERLAEEEKKAEDARIAEEARLAEEKKLQEEADRVAAQKAEEDRLEAERKAKEESDRLAEEARIAAEEARIAEEKKAQEEADRIAAQKAEEDRLEADRKAKEESDRLAEEARIAAEEARLAEEEKKIKEENDRIAAQKAEEDRLEAERKAKEESDRLAEEARLAAEETRIAEEKKKAQEEAEHIEAETHALHQEEPTKAEIPTTETPSTAPETTQSDLAPAQSETLQSALETTPSFNDDDFADENLEDSKEQGDATKVPSEVAKDAESDKWDSEDDDDGSSVEPSSARSLRSLRDSKEIPPSPKGPIAAFSSALDNDDDEEDDEEDLSAFQDKEDEEEDDVSEEELDPKMKLSSMLGGSLNDEDEIHTDSDTQSDISEDFPSPANPQSKEANERIRDAMQAGFDDGDDFGTDDEA